MKNLLQHINLGILAGALHRPHTTNARPAWQGDHAGGWAGSTEKEVARRRRANKQAAASRRANRA